MGENPGKCGWSDTFCQKVSKMGRFLVDFGRFFCAKMAQIVRFPGFGGDQHLVTFGRLERVVHTLNFDVFGKVRQPCYNIEKTFILCYAT